AGAGVLLHPLGVPVRAHGRGAAVGGLRARCAAHGPAGRAPGHGRHRRPGAGRGPRPRPVTAAGAGDLRAGGGRVGAGALAGPHLTVGPGSSWAAASSSPVAGSGRLASSTARLTSRSTVSRSSDPRIAVAATRAT